MNEGRRRSDYGHDFEKRVIKAFVRNGYALVERNSWRRNYDMVVDCAIKREFDIVLFNTYEREFYIVECKAHINKKNLVGSEMVRQFQSKIENYGGEGAVPLMVSDTGFSERASYYASRAKIYLMNGSEFILFEKQGGILKKARSNAFSFVMKRAESAVSKMIKSYVE